MKTSSINVVTVQSGWILQKIAERIVEAGGVNWSLSYRPMTNVDANLYVDVQNCYRGKTNTIDIGYFTHVHENNMKYVNPVTFTLDHIIHQCSRYRDMFSAFYPEDRMSVIHAGEVHDQFKLRKPTIGIVQRGLHEGKGYHFMLGLENYELLRNFKFVFVGTGWDEVVEKLQNNNVTAYHYISEKYDQYHILYESFDYLLIPSLWEGGPMSVLDAYGVGIPIISSNVGWMNEIGVEYMFNPGDKQSLYNILQTIYNEVKCRRDKVKQITYKAFIDGVEEIVEEL